VQLGITTFNIARDWDLPFLIKKCRELGIGGLEFRSGKNQAHGVEPEISKERRHEIRNMIEDAYLAVIGIGASSRFDHTDKAELQNDIDSAKVCIELCADLGGKTVRVYGNDVNPDLGRDKTVKQLGKCLAEVIPFGRQYGVEVLVEMHGQFNNFSLMEDALAASGIPDAGSIYNSDPRDIVGGSVAHAYWRARNRIKHVHVHDLCGAYPYRELFRLLKKDGYDGYISAELPYSADGERVLAYYVETFKLLCCLS